MKPTGGTFVMGPGVKNFYNCLRSPGINMDQDGLPKAVSAGAWMISKSSHFTAFE